MYQPTGGDSLANEELAANRSNALVALDMAQSLANEELTANSRYTGSLNTSACNYN
jgi:hypothetical protein